MSFLGELSNQINSQLSIGENTNKSLNSVIDGTNVQYGSLGDFAKQIDQSAERRYLEEGYLRRDPFNADPKQLEILMSEPSATVFIKKKMFSSIAENFNPSFMDKDEKLYFKTIKVLFDNKCKQISALEKLSKIQKVTAAAGSVSDSLMPIITSLSDTISEHSDNSEINNLSKVSAKLKKLYSFNSTNHVTTWIKDSASLFSSQFGTGTGVIELTNFTQFNTKTTVDSNGGSFSLSISDPYESMLITEWDIERAIADATSMFNNSKTFQLLGEQASEQIINDNQSFLNTLRKARGASTISIKVNPDTMFGKRVTAILDDLGAELVFTYDSSGGTDFPGLGGFSSNSVEVLSDYGNNNLSTETTQKNGNNFKLGNGKDLVKSSELDLFKRLITAIFTKIQTDANAKNAFQITNKDTNYVRRKMRFNFCGKLLIQPMDVVHIYISTKTRYDNKILSGLNNMFSGFGLLQKANILATDISTLSALFGGNTASSTEMAAYVGSDFPPYLWRALRPQFIGEKEGTHVFAGVVETATHRDDAGKFSVSVSGKDNIYYFEQGKVNFKPGVDSFNGNIFDPLTPFKSNFDTINTSSKANIRELLEENKAILGSKEVAGLVKYKSGPDAGKKAADDLSNDHILDPQTGNPTKIFHAPDGLVYKWKEGIGVFTQSGSSLDLNNVVKTGNPSITKDPFAGQDIMNVLSLLITGKPYNYATYWRTVAKLDGLTTDPQTKEDAAHSFINSLQTDLKKNNSLWGNFIPFKSLSINEKAFAAAQQKQYSITKKSNELDNKIQKLNELNNIGLLKFNTNVYAPKDIGKGQIEQIAAASNKLTDSINKDIEEIVKSTKDFDAASVAAGSDATFEISDLDNSPKGNNVSDTNGRRELRRKVNQLTRRMSYNVRDNTDNNLFIVDDFYDKDFDILAYEQALTDGVKQYNDEFLSTKSKIQLTAKLLNLEVFCDTQGHIRVRPPQYNRMPSSVFYRMMYLKEAYGIQVFPEFLSDLFTTQLNSLRERIEVLEDLIRLNCAIILNSDSESPGVNDLEASNFIKNNKTENNSADVFGFISDSSGGISDINKLVESVNRLDSEKVTDFVSTLKRQVSSNKEIIDNATRYKVVLAAYKTINGYKLPVDTGALLNQNSYIDQLITRIQTKSGQKVLKQDYIIKKTIGDGVATLNSNLDLSKATKELQEKLQERQRAVKIFYNTIKNAQEFRSLDNDKSVGNKLATPATYKNNNIPEVFEHMIEDEGFDDYGTNSGQRYVIKRAQIKSLDLAENPPDYNYVEVQGVLSPFALTLPEGLNSFPQSGNGMVTASALDYDSWRNYGLKTTAAIQVPFLNNPVTQCAPYATMLLSIARKNIIRGSVTIIGNEFMQPGEVVYIEHRGMLFYVSTVDHSFNNSGSFQTVLTLTYGHAPGEYIPTTLDIIGKLIYNNKDDGTLIVDRNSSSMNDNSLGAVLLNPDANVDTGDVGLPNTDSGAEKVKGEPNPPQSPYTTINSAVLTNILYTASYVMNANSTAGNNQQAVLQLRVYYDKNNPADSTLIKFAEKVKAVLIGKSSGKETNSSLANKFFPEESVKIEQVNLDDEKDGRSPSQKAIDSARNMKENHKPKVIATSSGDKVSLDHIRSSLFSYVVDCWINFEEVPTAQIQAETSPVKDTTKTVPSTSTSSLTKTALSPPREEF